LSSPLCKRGERGDFASRIKAPFDTQSLAEYLIAVLEGSLILAKAKQDTGVFEQNLQHFKRYVKTLFEK
jgi:hypothetical protein